MKQKLIIELDEQTTKNYLKWLQPVHEHCAETNCEFPGFILQVDIYPSISELIYGKDNNGLIELGNVSVNLVEFPND